MEKSKLESMAKTMKWIPVALGVVSLLLAAVALLVKMEDAAAKANILSFASLGLSGIALIVFGVGMSTTLSAIAELEVGKEEDEDEILP